MMPEKISLSVVIPVYNVENYLSKCLDSLLAAEGINDTEIILIDDGSTDNSGKVIEEYTLKHNNIRSFHTENSGAAAARNTGIRNAVGDYIFFCDSDDRVDPGLLGGIIRKIKTAACDMFMWDCELFYETKSILAKKDKSYFAHCGLDRIEKEYSGKKIMENLVIRGKGVIASVCLGCYRRKFLLDNELFFEEGIIYEDELWVPRVLLSAKAVHYIPEKVYIYRVHDGSVTNPGADDRVKNIKVLMYVYPSLYNYYDKVLAGDPLKDAVEGNLTKRYLHMIYKYRFWKYGYGKDIDKQLLWRTSRKLRHKIMVLGLKLIAK